MRLVLLGTGAGLTPKGGRQSAAAALRLGDRTYIVDCGSGVGGQLLRAAIPLGSIRAVLITHHHLDHVADFGLLFAQCWTKLNQPAALIGPAPIARMFDLFEEMFAIDLQTRVTELGREPLRSLVKISQVSSGGPCYEDELMRIQATSVPHSPLLESYCYRFDCAQGSVVFSGDTSFSTGLADFATGADTLVHEATFPSALAAEFPGKKGERTLQHLLRAHTSVSDAARVARRAKVRRLILSPISPGTGVSDREWIAAASTEFSGEIMVGRDLLEIAL